MRVLAPTPVVPKANLWMRNGYTLGIWTQLSTSNVSLLKAFHLYTLWGKPSWYGTQLTERPCHSYYRYTVLKLFTPFGKITKLDFMFHWHGPKKGTPRGYCFLEYETASQATAAVNQMNRKAIKLRPLNVSLANLVSGRRSRRVACGLPTGQVDRVFLLSHRS